MKDYTLKPRDQNTFISALLERIIVAGIFTTALVGLTALGPKLKNVNPNQLEIKVKDIDQDGDLDTTLNYKAKKYYFKEDEFGKPIAIPYEK